MSKPNSLQGIITDWRNLLAEVRMTPYGIPHIESFEIALEKALKETQAAKARQEACRAAKQRATRRLAKRVAEGRDAASRMRSFLRGRLGAYNEDLVRFGVAPIRKRGQRRAPQPPDPDSQAG